MAEVTEKTELANQIFARLEEIKKEIPGQVQEASQEIQNNVTKAAQDIVSINKELKQLEIAIARNASFQSVENTKATAEDLQKAREWMQKATVGNQIEVKALRTDSAPDGGYLVLPQFDTMIGKIIFETSPISRLASRATVSGNTWKKFIRDARLNATKNKLELEQVSESDTQEYKEISINLHSFFAKYPVSTEMLEDSSYNVEAELLEAVQEDFALDFERDLLIGNGVKTARGLLTYDDAGYTANTKTYAFNKISRVPSGNNTAIAGADNILNLFFALKSAYRNNATWLMNSFTHLEILKLKSSNNYHFLGFQPSDRQVGAPTLSILGRPIEYAEDMDTASDGQNSIILGFGDIARTYKIIEKPGTTILRDPYTKDDALLFKVKKRFGGGIQNFDSFVVMDANAS